MKTESLYDIVKIENDRVFIIDLNLPNTRSVTNDAEKVWKEIQTMFPNKRLIYRDTMGRWDEIICGPLGSITFHPYYAYFEHTPNF
jgi:hypothetical protein